MRYALILTPILAALLSLDSYAHADSPYDMATFSCQDWLDASDDDQDLMLVWLRGYNAGRTGVSLYTPNALLVDRGRMQSYCRAHLTVGVISAIGQMAN